MTYTKDQFLRCRFNPLQPDLVKTYPQLADLSGDVKLLRYVLALYDPHSPLIKDHTDLGVRKQAAATLAGYDILKDDAILQDYFEFAKDSPVIPVVHGYLKDYVQVRLWSKIVSAEQMFWEFNERLRRKVSEENGDKDELQAVELKRKLSQSLDEIDERLEGYYEKFYHGDTALQEQSKKLRLTPENIAGLK